ncbi:MAG TPA: DUF418 domain-containing protein [Allosphingosinicella sp.]|jgi:uncharacterized protein
MTAVTEPPPRIATLDILRGVAVMGILAMNIAAFSMPPQAYFNPIAFGNEGPADIAAWAVNFVLVDGKMRALFSFLFGASMLLVIERAAAKGESAASVHFRRMLWLLLFGYLHFFLIWYGDILTGYATIGMIAWFFRRKSAKALLRWGILFVVIEILVLAVMAAGIFYLSSVASQPGAEADAVRQWTDLQRQFGVPTAEDLRRELALYEGSWTNLVHHQVTKKTFEPLGMLAIFGWETLGYMLLGMAALRSGFFTGAWDDARYRKIALIGFAITVPAYALLAYISWSNDFAVPVLFACSLAAPALLRPLMVTAIAAVIILLTRRGGALTERIAAAGRAAFTNYLGTSLLMTALFYGWGFGLWGDLRRIELWIVLAAMWTLMLLWSKPWLERFQYGPFEWLWRSLSRWGPQPMRQRPAPEPAAA